MTAFGIAPARRDDQACGRIVEHPFPQGIGTALVGARPLVVGRDVRPVRLVRAEEFRGAALHAAAVVFQREEEHLTLLALQFAEAVPAGSDGDGDLERHPGLADLRPGGEEHQTLDYDLAGDVRERWKDGEPQVCEIVALMVAVAVRPECLSRDRETRRGRAGCLSSDAPLVSPIAALASRHEHAAPHPASCQRLAHSIPAARRGAVRIVVGEYRDALDAGDHREGLNGAGRAERPHRSPAGGADAHPGFEAFADAEAIGHLGVVIELDRGTADRASIFFPRCPRPSGASTMR